MKNLKKEIENKIAFLQARIESEEGAKREKTQSSIDKWTEKLCIKFYA